jgi:hypothetical protein
MKPNIIIIILVLLLAGTVIYFKSCKPETVTLQRDSVAQAKIDSLEAVSDHRQYIEDSLIAVIDSLRDAKKTSVVIYNNQQVHEETKPASSLYFDLNNLYKPCTEQTFKFDSCQMLSMKKEHNKADYFEQKSIIDEQTIGTQSELLKQKDFDISDLHLIVNAKDDQLNKFEHTKIPIVQSQSWYVTPAWTIGGMAFGFTVGIIYSNLKK